MPYRSENSEDCDNTIGFLGKLRMKSPFLSLLVGASFMVGMGLVEYIAIPILMGFAAVGFIITICVSSEPHMSDKTKYFGIYPALSLFGTIIITGAIVLLTGFHHVPTTAQKQLDLCTVKLHATEVALVTQFKE